MRRTTLALACGLVGAAALLAGPGLVSWRSGPDAVLATGFGSALADADASWSSTPPNVWLSGLGDPTAAFGKSLGVGDLVTVAGQGGLSQIIEVTALEHVDGARIGLAGVRFQLVTGRPKSGPSSGVVRFLFASETPQPLGPIDGHARDRVL
jgi:hypothetical protein